MSAFVLDYTPQNQIENLIFKQLILNLKVMKKIQILSKTELQNPLTKESCSWTHPLLLH